MKPEIVKLVIKDYEMIGDAAYPNGILKTYYLLSPNKIKLAELKKDIEERFNYDGLDEEDIESKEEFCDDIWNCIEYFISKNFVTLDIEETYEIEY